MGENFPKSLVDEVFVTRRERSEVDYNRFQIDVKVKPLPFYL